MVLLPEDVAVGAGDHRHHQGGVASTEEAHAKGMGRCKCHDEQKEHRQVERSDRVPGDPFDETKVVRSTASDPREPRSEVRDGRSVRQRPPEDRCGGHAPHERVQVRNMESPRSPTTVELTRCGSAEQDTTEE